MHIPKEKVPVKIDVPGAKARQISGFGAGPGTGEMAGEYFSLGAGTDIAPLLKGLKDDTCQAPHWGYVISGKLVVSYSDGNTETCSTSDLFYWPPGHSVRVEQDAEIVLFSPEREHTAVMNHMTSVMNAGSA